MRTFFPFGFYKKILERVGGLFDILLRDKSQKNAHEFFDMLISR